MPDAFGTKPEWLTFDCYGTLIQWDEGLIAAVQKILSKQPDTTIDTRVLIDVFDRREHALETEKPHRSFRAVASESLRRAMTELGLQYRPDDIEVLTSSISKMPPFPEVVGALSSSADRELCRYRTR